MRRLPDSLHAARRHVVFSAAAVVGTACMAGVTAIHEGGPTIPIGQHLAAFLAPASAPSHGAAPAQVGALPATFPIATEAMRPGRLQAPMRVRSAGWLAAPMFILGDDPQSRQWLAANRNRLHRLGASGLVVQVASIDTFRSLRAIAPELPMAPSSIEKVARQAGLSVYPLFVGADGRASQVVP